MRHLERSTNDIQLAGEGKVQVVRRQVGNVRDEIDETQNLVAIY